MAIGAQGAPPPFVIDSFYHLRELHHTLANMYCDVTILIYCPFYPLDQRCNIIKQNIWHLKLILELVESWNMKKVSLSLRPSNLITTENHLCPQGHLHPILLRYVLHRQDRFYPIKKAIVWNANSIMKSPYSWFKLLFTNSPIQIKIGFSEYI